MFNVFSIPFSFNFLEPRSTLVNILLHLSVVAGEAGDEDGEDGDEGEDDKEDREAGGRQANSVHDLLGQHLTLVTNYNNKLSLISLYD